MRTNSVGSTNDLHFHDSSTCHGSPTLQECADEAIRRGWVGKVLEKTDSLNGVDVKCYSLIAGHFDHWAKHGKFVGDIKLQLVVATGS